MIIRTADGFRFTLEKDQIVERTDLHPYRMSRSVLQKALSTNAPVVTYQLEITDYALSYEGYIEHGVTQRKKKFISIGCMRFVGVNRARLIRWAKSAK